MEEENKPIDEEKILRIEKAVEALKLENDRQEAIIREKKAIAALGGNSEAGITQEAPRKITDKEYANAALRGEII